MCRSSFPLAKQFSLASRHALCGLWDGARARSRGASGSCRGSALGSVPAANRVLVFPTHCRWFFWGWTSCLRSLPGCRIGSRRRSAQVSCGQVWSGSPYSSPSCLQFSLSLPKSSSQLCPTLPAITLAAPLVLSPAYQRPAPSSRPTCWGCRAPSSRPCSPQTLGLAASPGFSARCFSVGCRF